MPLAAHHRLADFGAVEWTIRARVARARLVADVHHTIVGMMLTESRGLAALDVEARAPHARAL